MRNYDTPVRAIRHKVFVEVAKAGFESTDETLIQIRLWLLRHKPCGGLL